MTELLTIEDAYYTIGSTHAVCQDYARAKASGGVVSLSDGCGSAPYSDIGARLVVGTSLRRESGIFGDEGYLTELTNLAEKLCITTDCLLATLLQISAGDNEFNCWLYGDGLIAAKHQNSNSYAVFKIEYPSNAPFYPYYWEDSFPWITSFGCERQITGYIFDPDNGELEEFSEASQDVDGTEEGDFLFKFPYDDYSSVIGFSDGIFSFNKDHKSAVPLKKVLSHFLGFPNTDTVGFLQRRCNKAKKELLKEGFNHYDDLSAVAMSVLIRMDDLDEDGILDEDGNEPMIIDDDEPSSEE